MKKISHWTEQQRSCNQFIQSKYPKNYKMLGSCQFFQGRKVLLYFSSKVRGSTECLYFLIAMVIAVKIDPSHNHFLLLLRFIT